MNNKGLAGYFIVLLISILAIASVIIIGNWDKVQDILGEGSNNAGISVTLYDKDGNPINAMPLSIVTAPSYNPVPGVKYISLTTTILNTGSMPLSCSLISATPSAFDSALVKTAKVVPSTGSKKASWTSNAFDVTPFEGTPTPDVFSITARCSYNAGTDTIYLPDQSFSLSLIIAPDGTGSFTVNIESPGGLGTEYCGNSVCESAIGETATTCPQDCASVTNVKFRASDLSYVSGSAVAYGATCGSALTRYGFSAQTSLLAGTCPAKMGTESWCGASPAKLSDIPGGYLSGGSSASLWKPADSSTICVCDDDGASYRITKYLTTDPDSSKVSDLAQSFDTAKEVSC